MCHYLQHQSTLQWKGFSVLFVQKYSQIRATVGDTSSLLILKKPKFLALDVGKFLKTKDMQEIIILAVLD